MMESWHALMQTQDFLSMTFLVLCISRVMGNIPLVELLNGVGRGFKARVWFCLLLHEGEGLSFFTLEEFHAQWSSCLWQIQKLRNPRSCSLLIGQSWCGALLLGAVHLGCGRTKGRPLKPRICQFTLKACYRNILGLARAQLMCLLWKYEGLCLDLQHPPKLGAPLCACNSSTGKGWSR